MFLCQLVEVFLLVGEWMWWSHYSMKVISNSGE